MESTVDAPGLLLVTLDMTGIFVFAISGGLVGVRKGLDLFGVLVLAAATGLGGGFIRDVLIGDVPPAALEDWRYLVVPVAAGLVTFRFHPTLGRMERLVTVFDAAGLGLFCVTGALKATEFGLGPFPAALMGTLTAVGGGVVRDLLAGRVPVVLRSELDATPALVGAAVAVAGDTAGLATWVFAIPAAALCTVWRLVAVRRDWHAPRAGGSAST
ncbi:MAG: trimeric intracellular cation channel family protein [Nocardioidaceae bacterium]